MQPSRRSLLRAGLGATAVACAGRVPEFLQQTAAAMPRATSDGRILVVIELDGGNDGLNTIVPYGDDLYYANRPTLNVPTSEVVKIDAHVGFHLRVDHWRSYLKCNSWQWFRVLAIPTRIVLTLKACPFGIPARPMHNRGIAVG